MRNDFPSIWKSRRQSRIAACCLSGIFTVAWGAASQSGEEPGFKEFIKPFFESNCLRCHGPERSKGDIRLDQLLANGAVLAANAQVWKTVMEQIEVNDMPPRMEPQPDLEAKSGVVKWILANLHKSGNDPRFARSFPAKGNYVRHEDLFGRIQQASATEASPPRIWRLRPDAYLLRLQGFVNQSTDDIPLDKVRAQNDPGEQRKTGYLAPMTLSFEPGFRDFAFRYLVTGPEIDQLMINAKIAVNNLFILSDLPKDNVVRVHFVKNQKPAPDIIKEAVLLVFRRALLRDPTSAEVERYMAFAQKCVDQLGCADGLKSGLAPILVRPDFIFRTEIGDSATKNLGRVMLAPLELAEAITCAFTDLRPDATMISAVKAGRLNSKDDVRHQVQRIFDDEGFTKTRIRDFFREYFGYDRANDVFKDAVALKAAQHLGPWYPEAYIRDSDALVEMVLKEDRDVLTRLLTDTSQPYGFKAPSQHSGKVSDKGSATRAAAEPSPAKKKAAPPANEVRKGILMQVAWMVANSSNTDNHAIHRGRWIRENLLGGMIPDVPITVDAKLPDEPNNSLRNRMRVTRQDYCWKCHQRMDPLGLVFEDFNHLGAPVKQRKGDKRYIPPDTSGDVIDSGIPGLDGPVTDARELIDRLAASDHVKQVFVRHAFRFWMGRNETIADAADIQAAYAAYKDNQGSMRALITSLLTSDAFIYRQQNDLPSPQNTTSTNR